MNHEPPIRIILPAFNEREHVAQAIESLQRQTCTRWQAVVVANACTDDTAAIVRGFNAQNIRVIETPRQGISLAKNIGYREEKADARLIAFMDSDCVAEDDLLETVVGKTDQGYEGGKVSVHPLDDDRLRARLYCAWGDFIHPIAMRFQGMDTGGGCFTFLTKELAGRIENPDGGVFNEKLRVMEDIDIMVRMKAAGRCTFIDTSHVLTSMRRFKEEGYLKCIIEDSFHAADPQGKTRARWQIPEQK